MKDLNGAGFWETTFPPIDIGIERREDGSMVMRCRTPLEVREASLPAFLRRQAGRRPDAQWLAQRRPPTGDWHTVSFGEARGIVDSLAQGLIELGLEPGAPLAILSGNSIEHALITFAAMQVGIPVAPISTAYSLQSSDFTKLREVLATVKPAALFVQSGAVYGRALQALDLAGTPVIAVEEGSVARGDLAYADLAGRQAGPGVERAFAAIERHAAAKLMFTSGSTGTPKAVIHTHWNLCFATEAILTGFGQTAEGRMVRLEWAPWSHVFGATSLAMSLVCGGQYYIDDGRPVGPLFAETVRNLREIATTTYASVPAAYAAMVDAMEQDESLARGFFKRLDTLTYAGARLPDDTARRMQLLALKHTGGKVPFTTGYGSTETGPGGAAVYWPTDRVGFIGLPQPGFALKLIPIDGERYEVLVRGEGVMPAYHGRPELTREVFDGEGFYRMGDAATFVNPAEPLEGLIFAGRLSEEFKLQTGTFVLAGSLRVAVIDALAPLLQDVVVCGEDRAFVAVLAWLNVDAARDCVQRPDATREELNADARVRGRVSAALAAYNASKPASSTRIERFHLLDEAPSIDTGEITDKGSINQRAVQRLRRPLVDTLFAPVPPDSVVEVARSAVLS